MPTLFKYAVNFCCVKYGWHSIWFIAGLLRHEASNRLTWAALKFETPMLLTKPASTAASIDFQVSTKSTDEKMSLSFGSFGKFSPSSLYANGQWIKYKSKYGVFNNANDFCNAGITKSGRWYVFHNLLVMNRSSLLTTPSLIFALIPSPTSASLP